MYVVGNTANAGSNHLSGSRHMLFEIDIAVVIVSNKTYIAEHTFLNS